MKTILLLDKYDLSSSGIKLPFSEINSNHLNTDAKNSFKAANYVLMVEREKDGEVINSKVLKSRKGFFEIKELIDSISSTIKQDFFQMKNAILISIFLILNVTTLNCFSGNIQEIKPGQIWVYSPSDIKLAKKFKINQKSYYKVISVKNDCVVFVDLKTNSFKSSKKYWFVIDSRLCHEKQKIEKMYALF